MVLVGGRSSRMGSAKAALPWHGDTLLGRTVRILQRSLPVAVVRAPDQELPGLPDDVAIVDDEVEGRGPLQGLAAGLSAMRDRGEVAFLCSTDLPFLHPAYVARVLDAVEREDDAVVPHARGHRQPLAAAYRTSLGPTIRDLVHAGERKPKVLLDRIRTRWLSDGDLLADPRLSALDPDLASVHNLNEPADYDDARAAPPPTITVERFGTLALGSDTARGPQHVGAATIGEAARAVDLTFDRHVVAALNGETVTHDEQVPLVTGDHLAFIAADAGG